MRINLILLNILSNDTSSNPPPLFSTNINILYYHKHILSILLIIYIYLNYNENLKTGINIVKKINGFDLKFNIDTDIDGNNQNSNIFINKSF